MQYESGDLDESLIRVVAQRAGMHEVAVANLFSGPIRMDLENDEGVYQSQTQAYQEGEIADARLSAFIERHVGNRSRLFVMHTMLSIWDSANEDLTWFLVRDVDGDGEEFGKVLSGYLINTGLFYPTTLSLLEAASKERWDKWDILWSKYF